MPRRVLALVFAGAIIASGALAQTNRIDTVTPSAPELAPLRAVRRSACARCR